MMLKQWSRGIGRSLCMGCGEQLSRNEGLQPRQRELQRPADSNASTKQTGQRRSG